MRMINPSTKKKIRRVVAAYLALNLLAQYFIPVSAFALTGGPSQPEVESFEPVSTTARKASISRVFMRLPHNDD